jgi:hypothetical protein
MLLAHGVPGSHRLLGRFMGQMGRPRVLLAAIALSTKGVDRPHVRTHQSVRFTSRWLVKLRE